MEDPTEEEAEDEKLIALQELQAWKHDTKSFLWKDVLQTIENALNEMERIDFLWGKIRIEKLTVSPVIKADIRMEGHLIVFANMELKLPRLSRGNQVLGMLQQYCVLNQILEFHGILQTQSARLNDLRAFLLQEDKDQNDMETYRSIVRVVSKSLVEICQQLRQAANILRLPSRRRFPYCSHVDLSFKPPLPSEVVVDFSIHRGEMLMEVFTLGTTFKPISTNADILASKKEFVGRVCFFRGQRVEILEYASISVPIPQLEEMLGALEEQIHWLVHIRNNVQALLQCIHQSFNNITRT